MMSKDFALQKLCSHEIRMETGTYDGVNGLVRFRTPPTNQRIGLWIDGAFVPPAGLWSYATVAFMNPGPYRIKQGQNDLLYMKIGNNPPAFVQLITGNAKPQDIARDLTLKVPSLKFFVKNEKVVIQSKNPTNGAAFSFVDPRWTDKTQSLPTTARVLAAYAKLGIVPGRVVTGKMLFPPWTLEKYAASSAPLEMIVQFHGVIPNQYPVVKLSYVTYPNYCRRCGGTRIEFDYNVLNNSYETVEDADLLSQEFDKFLFTRLGSHWKWPWLGSRLVDRIGGKGSAGRVTVNSMLSMDVSQAFNVYQNIKLQQSQDSSQQVSDAEYPLSVQSINVSTLPDDPTVALVNTVILCRSRIPITLKRVVGNPNPYTIGMNMNLAMSPDFLLRG